MTPEELQKVEDMVNESISRSLPVVIKNMPIEEARKTGAQALFGEKYGDIVRVVNMGDTLLSSAVVHMLPIQARSEHSRSCLKVVWQQGYAVSKHLHPKD